MPADLPPQCIVQHVRDGDTWRCADGTVVRGARFDTADSTSSTRCRRKARGAWCDNRMAAKGRVALTSLIGGRAVRCVPMPAYDGARTAYDRYRRIVARCSIDGRDIGDTLLAMGLARRWP